MRATAPERSEERPGLCRPGLEFACVDTDATVASQLGTAIPELPAGRRGIREMKLVHVWRDATGRT